MSFSIWVGLGQAVNTINWRFDQLLAGYMLGNAQLGYYSVGDRLAVLPTREATQPLAQAVFPGFARLADDPPRLRAAYRRAQTALSAVALPAGVGFAVTAEPLVLLAMGEDWRPVIPVIQILASIFAVQTLATPVQPLAMGLGATRALFNRSVLTLAIRVPITVFGLLAGGLMGLLWARCATGLIGMAINMHLVTRLMAVPVLRQVTGNARTLAATAAMAAATHGAGQALTPGDAGTWPALLLQAGGMIATGALVYPAAMLGLWFAAGRPDGPERDMIHFGGASLAAARLRLTARPAGLHPYSTALQLDAPIPTGAATRQTHADVVHRLCAMLDRILSPAGLDPERPGTTRFWNFPDHANVGRQRDLRRRGRLAARKNRTGTGLRGASWTRKRGLGSRGDPDIGSHPSAWRRKLRRHLPQAPEFPRGNCWARFGIAPWCSCRSRSTSETLAASTALPPPSPTTGISRF